MKTLKRNSSNFWDSFFTRIAFLVVAVALVVTATISLTSARYRTQITSNVVNYTAKTIIELVNYEPYTDSNSNGQWDNGETYTDLNDNGEYDDSLDYFVLGNDWVPGTSNIYTFRVRNFDETNAINDIGLTYSLMIESSNLLPLT